MLNERERQALHCIDTWIKLLGCAPTREDLRLRMGLKSRSHAQRLIDSLVRQGYLRRLPHRMQAIEVVGRVQYFRFDDETKQFVEWRP